MTTQAYRVSDHKIMQLNHVKDEDIYIATFYFTEEKIPKNKKEWETGKRVDGINMSFTAAELLKLTQWFLEEYACDHKKEAE